MSKRPDYSYAGNSNLVLRQERKNTKNEPTGEPESLYGKINPKEMGSKITKNKPEKNKLEKIKEKTKKSKVYEMILYLVGQFVEQEYLHDAVDEILKGRKSYNLREFVESVLGGRVGDDAFSRLNNLLEKIDYELSGENGSRESEVAVLFDEGEEREGEESEEDEFIEEEAEFENEIREEREGELLDEFVEKEGEEIINTKTLQPQKHELNPKEIDAFWLQRTLSNYFKEDAQEILSLSLKIFSILEDTLNDERDCENQLVELLNFDKFDLVKLLCKNREIIYFCILLRKAEDKKQVEGFMIKQGYSDVLQRIKGETTNEILQGETGVNDDGLVERQQRREQEEEDTMEVEEYIPNVVDLDSLKFTEGSHLMSNKKVILPEGSYKESKEGYDEITIPAPKPASTSGRLISIQSMPAFAQIAFKNTENLNKVQSAVYKTAFGSDENMLLCAPTGAGKTNCAMLCILREIGKHVTFVGDNTVEVGKNFKIVYIAPMKALVQEMVGNFQSRLDSYGLSVRELTGDVHLTRKELDETDIIVTTPEKFDIITRKGNDREYTQMIRLVIIDEIHLLHDERGPVLESIIARLLRQIEDSQENVRLVGLSATLPNYMDVGIFMRVEKENIFYFDGSYRPCPLRQKYIGVSAGGVTKRVQTMNRICYDKCLTECTNGNQVLIFVHSRKETAKTGNVIKQFAIDEETLAQFISKNSASWEILNTEVQEGRVDNRDLQELLTFGIGIHHAGMTRNDRTLVEDLFAEGHIKVLVSTATLAWGVNLPAHCVIIKGTQIYNPEKGDWVELSIQDVLQMLGRAGRPQYDTFGEGVIITTQKEMQFYLSLVNTQLPIESQMISKLADVINGEIVLNSVKSLDEGVEWLGYSYLYVRMMRNPELYGVDPNFKHDDRALVAKRKDLVHSAFLLLEKSHLIKYDKRTKQVQPTEMGRISSHYYINHKSMFVYLQQLKPWMNLIDILRVFSQSEEFRLIPVRQEEKVELNKLIERVPIPIKDADIDENNLAKVNVLLQAYISQLKLEGFAMLADMVYIHQSAGRIVRAMFEIALKRDWAELSRRLLELCQMIDHRQWSSMSVLRQIKQNQQQKLMVPLDLIKKIEKTNIPYDRLFDLSDVELGELVRNQKAGKLLHNALHFLPKVELEVRVMPITRTLIKLEVTVNAVHDVTSSNAGTIFWLLVEDGCGEHLLSKTQVILPYRKRQVFNEVYVNVNNANAVSNIFVSMVPDKFLGLETKLPISFRQMILPSKFHPPSELLDLAPVTLREIFGKMAAENKKSLKYKPTGDVFDTPLNSILNNSINAVFSKENENVLVCANNNDLAILADLALIHAFEEDSDLIVYCCESEDKIKFMYERFSSLFSSNKEFAVKPCKLHDTLNFVIPDHCNLFVTTYNYFEPISKRLKKNLKNKNLKLVIADDLNMINTNFKIETTLCRLLNNDLVGRIFAISKSVTTSKELADFLNVPFTTHCFNFAPNIRDLPLEIHLSGINNNSYYTSDYVDLVTLQLIQSGSVKKLFKDTLRKDSNMIAFLPSKKQVKLILNDIIRLYDNMVGVKENNEMDYNVSNPVLAYLLKLTGGQMAFVYETLSDEDVIQVCSMFHEGITKVLFATKPMVNRLNCNNYKLFSSLVAILGTRYYESVSDLRNKDYSVNDLHDMISYSNPSIFHANLSTNNAKLYLFSGTTSLYKKFLFEGIPVESCLDVNVNEYLLNELDLVRTIENRQEGVELLSKSFYYKRLSKNPNYYNLYLPPGTLNFNFQLVNEKLSEVVETSFEDMLNSKLIKLEEEDEAGAPEVFSPLNFGLIAAFYNLDFLTIDIYSISLNKHSKLKSCLEVLSYSNEFIRTLPVREDDFDSFAKEYSKVVPYMASSDMDDFNAGLKAFILFQLYFSRYVSAFSNNFRAQLSIELKNDLHDTLLPKVLTLLYAMIDVLSSNSLLSPCLLCMELCQMMVQGQWEKDSPLLQLPFFTKETVELCKELKIDTVFDLLDYVNEKEENDEENEVFKGLKMEQVADIATVCNKYPNIETKFELSEKVEEKEADDDGEDVEMTDAGKEISYILSVELSKDFDEEGPEELNYFKQFDTKNPKQSNWWLVIGLDSTKELISIKRFCFTSQNTSTVSVQNDNSGEEEQKYVLKTELNFELKKEIVEAVKNGDEGIKLYLMSDSWIGCDQEYEIPLN